MSPPPPPKPGGPPSGQPPKPGAPRPAGAPAPRPATTRQPAAPARPAAPTPRTTAGGARPPAAAPGRPPAGKAPPPTGRPPAKPAAPARPAAPAKAAPPAPAKPPSPPKDPNLERAGRYFEIRKGRARSDEDEEGEERNFQVALPRSIIQEQEEKNLKRRLGTEELPDIQERHAAVKVVDAPPETMSRKAGGKWMLVALALFLVVGVLFTFREQILAAIRGK